MIWWGLLALGMGCAPEGTGNREKEGSWIPEASGYLVGGHLISSDRGDVMYAANTDVNTISRVSVRDLSVSEVRVPSGPVQLASHGDQVYASLRGDGSIAVMTDDGTALTRELEIPIGAEPYGLALSADGERLYVALVIDKQVVEVDTTTGTILRRWDLPFSPKWVSLAPDQRTLAANGDSKTIAWIELEEDRMRFHLAPPVSLPDRASTRSLAQVRFTGALTFSPDQGQLVAPMLLVNPVVQPEEDEPEQTSSYGGSSQPDGLPLIPGTTPFTAAILTVPILDNAPDTHAGQYIGVQGNRSLNADKTFGTYITEVDFVDDDTLLAAMESSDMVVMVDLGSPFIDIFQGSTWVQLHPMAAQQVPGGPRSLAWIDEHEAYGYNLLDRSIVRMDLERMLEALHEHQILVDRIHATSPLESFIAEQVPEMVWARSYLWTLEADLDAVLISSRTLEPANERGRRLFFSSTAPSMSDPDAAVSCSTCHIEGRNDGITWVLEDGPRQTPSLSGGIEDTAPFTWNNEVTDIAAEVEHTSTMRMDGEGPGTAGARDVEMFIRGLRRAAVPSALDPSVIQRGAAAFRKAGCLGCHSGDAYTDNQHHQIINRTRTNTPSLRGIASTAPYFHDGSSETLMGALLRSKDGSMGDTSNLELTEMQALVEFLRSL